MCEELGIQMMWAVGGNDKPPIASCGGLLTKLNWAYKMDKNFSARYGFDANASDDCDEKKRQFFGELFRIAHEMAIKGFTNEEIQIICFMKPFRCFC